MKRVILFTILLMLCITPLYAQKNNIKLLAVVEESKKGSVVNLDLDVVPGSGRVFVETLPLSQIDTQISLRFGKTIACQTANAYCLNKDFFYTVRTSSPVIAGPSAGAAITLLTMASLDDVALNPNIVITGTINSGGVIGPVGGVKEKIQAAIDAGLTQVLIPKGEENASEYIAYGAEHNITITEVSTIDEAYELFTGHKKAYPPLEADETYAEIMRNVSGDMCARNIELSAAIAERLLTQKQNSTLQRAINLSAEAQRLFSDKKYYSSASRCFGSNVLLRELLLLQNNQSLNQSAHDISYLQQRITEIELAINATEINKLGDLETAMIIRERIEDARNNIIEFNETNSFQDLSYAIERTHSANAWRKFLGYSGKNIDESRLRESCILKIQEVRELHNYVTIYLPTIAGEITGEVDRAEEYLNSNDYALCLFKASKSRAEINAALSTLYVSEDNVKTLYANKLSAAQTAIQKQIEEGTFPILGYSYYEYAQVLNESETYSGLLYAEYGIELSNLNIYFPQKRPYEIEINRKALFTLIAGFVIGVLVLSLHKPYQRNKISLKRK